MLLENQTFPRVIFINLWIKHEKIRRLILPLLGGRTRSLLHFLAFTFSSSNWMMKLATFLWSIFINLCQMCMRERRLWYGAPKKRCLHIYIGKIGTHESETFWTNKQGKCLTAGTELGFEHRGAKAWTKKISSDMVY